MTCHLITKAVTKQNCIEALNQHAQLLKDSPRNRRRAPPPPPLSCQVDTSR